MDDSKQTKTTWTALHIRTAENGLPQLKIIKHDSRAQMEESSPLLHSFTKLSNLSNIKLRKKHRIDSRIRINSFQPLLLTRSHSTN